ncbi:hypothetical protein DFQ26_000743, partial [Actinomortierella ambigua]
MNKDGRSLDDIPVDSAGLAGVSITVMVSRRTLMMRPRGTEELRTEALRTEELRTEDMWAPELDLQG